MVIYDMHIYQQTCICEQFLENYVPSQWDTLRKFTFTTT